MDRARSKVLTDTDLKAYITKLQRIERNIQQKVETVEKYYKKIEKIITKNKDILSIELLNTDQNLLQQEHIAMLFSQKSEMETTSQHFLSKNSLFQPQSQTLQKEKQPNFNMVINKIKSLNEKVNELSDSFSIINGMQTNLSVQTNVSKYLWQSQQTLQSNIMELDKHRKNLERDLQQIKQNQQRTNSKLELLGQYLAKAGHKYSSKLKL